MPPNHLAAILERLYDLRRDSSSGYEKPYKPALILAILDLIERGDFSKNQFPLSDALIDRYREYIKIVGTPLDHPRIEYPYYHLSGDGFWKLLPAEGEDSPYTLGQAGRSPGISRLRSTTRGGQFHPEFFQAFYNPVDREIIRWALVARYFPIHRDAIRQAVTHFLKSDAAAEHPSADSEKVQQARDPAFRKIILDQYDCTCAACRIRVKVQELVIVDAAHLIPWSTSQNDHPSNGLALCKNHHWAMDRHLIAPGPDRRWHVSPTLDPCDPALKPLSQLKDRPLVHPKEKKFIPAEEALTGYRLLTDDGTSIVEAAHIDPWATSMNDDIHNGLALSRNAHWAFDRGLWSVDPNNRVLLNNRRFQEWGPAGHLIARHEGSMLQFDPQAELRPHLANFAKHRKKHGFE